MTLSTINVNMLFSFSNIEHILHLKNQVASCFRTHYLKLNKSTIHLPKIAQDTIRKHVIDILESTLLIFKYPKVFIFHIYWITKQKSMIRWEYN